MLFLTEEAHSCKAVFESGCFSAYSFNACSVNILMDYFWYFYCLTKFYWGIPLVNPVKVYTPNTMFASIFSFRLISRATFNVGSHLPVR